MSIVRTGKRRFRRDPISDEPDLPPEKKGPIFVVSTVPKYEISDPEDLANIPVGNAAKQNPFRIIFQHSEGSVMMTIFPENNIDVPNSSDTPYKSGGMKRVYVGAGHKVYQPSGAHQRVFFGPGNQVKPFIMTEFGIPTSGVFDISVDTNIISDPPVPMRVQLVISGRLIDQTQYQYGGQYSLEKRLMLPQGSVIHLYLEKRSGPSSEALIMGSHTSIIRIQ